MLLLFACVVFVFAIVLLLCCSRIGGCLHSGWSCCLAWKKESEHEKKKKIMEKSLLVRLQQNNKEKFQRFVWLLKCILSAECDIFSYQNLLLSAVPAFFQPTTGHQWANLLTHIHCRKTVQFGDQILACFGVVHENLERL